jgi:hypothetical protein
MLPSDEVAFGNHGFLSDFFKWLPAQHLTNKNGTRWMI